MKKVMIAFAVIFAVIVNFSYAQTPSVMLSNKPGWHKIGEVKADFKMEDQSIAVLGKDRFKSILLKVTDAPINIEDVTVVFENGETQDIHVKSELKAGSETRQIDLKGGSPEIKEVKFKYKTLPNQKEDKAHVELYGLK